MSDKLRGGTTIGGNLAWHTGNDGEGSGLDADLLDGQHGSYYATKASVDTIDTSVLGLAPTANVINSVSSQQWVSVLPAPIGSNAFTGQTYVNYDFGVTIPPLLSELRTVNVRVDGIDYVWVITSLTGGLTNDVQIESTPPISDGSITTLEVLEERTEITLDSSLLTGEEYFTDDRTEFTGDGTNSYSFPKVFNPTYVLKRKVPLVSGAPNSFLDRLNGSVDGAFVSITEGGHSGYGIQYRALNPDNYGNIGGNAVDLSYNDTNTVTRGATGSSSTAMGYGTTASGYYSTAMGYGTTASGYYSTAMGIISTSCGYASTAMGCCTTASGAISTAMGYCTAASGSNSTAMGSCTIACGYGSTAMGGATTASGCYSIAIGSSTTASGNHSTAIGRNTVACGPNSTAMGNVTTASGCASTAMGYLTRATCFYSTAMGSNTISCGCYSTSMGSATTASGSYSTAMSVFTIASGNTSTAMGYGTTASGCASTAMGDYTTASGCVSTAMGYNTTVTGTASTVMGYNAHVSCPTSTSANSLIMQYNAPTILLCANEGNGYFDGGADIGVAADYAEYFESANGSCLERGHFVSFAEGSSCICYGNTELLGIVSADPAIVGDTHSFQYQGMYLKDEFGVYIREAQIVTGAVNSRVEEIRTNAPEVKTVDAEGNYTLVPQEDLISYKVIINELPDDMESFEVVITNKETKEIVETISTLDIVADERIYDFEVEVAGTYDYTIVDRVKNPDYDTNLEYLPRSARPEWSPIGLLGKLWVYLADGEIVNVGDYVTANSDGKAIKCLRTDRNACRVMETNPEFNLVKVFFKGN